MLPLDYSQDPTIHLSHIEPKTSPSRSRCCSIRSLTPRRVRLQSRYGDPGVLGVLDGGERGAA
jgi:hypothetical protein